MRAGRAAIAALLLVGLAPYAGWSAPSDPVAVPLDDLVRRAALACDKGTREQGNAALRELVRATRKQLGPDDPFTRSVAEILHESVPVPTPPVEAGEPAFPRARPTPWTDEQKQSALKRLAVCRGPGPIVLSIPFADRIQAAKQLEAFGKHREALREALAAEATSQASGDATQRMIAGEVLAILQLELGHVAEALESARRAQAAAMQLGQAGIGIRISLARVYTEAGDPETAGDLLEELQEQVESEEDRAALAQARGQLALRAGSPDRALQELEHARRGIESTLGAEHPTTAAVLQQLGDAQRMAGNYPAALAAYESSLHIREAHYGARHAETARSWNALGVLRSDFGDWAQADGSFAHAEAILTAPDSLGPEHPETRTVHANRALAHWAVAKSAAAAREYAAATEELVRALGPVNPGAADALRNLARIEGERGLGDRADRHLQEALKLQTEALGPEHPALAQTLVARARLRAKRGSLDQAAADAAHARDVLRRAFGAEHPLVARAEGLLGRIGAAQGDAKAPREAEHALSALAAHARHSFGAMSDRQRVFLADDAREALGALLSRAEVDPREAYLSYVPHRDAVLRSIAASRAAARSGNGPARQLLERLRELREHYASSVLETGLNTGRAAELGEQIDAMEASAAAAGAEQAIPDPATTFARACERLDPQAALIDFVAYDETRAGKFASPVPSYAAFVVLPACRVERVSLGAAEPIDRAVEELLGAMREQNNDARGARTRLARLVLAPLRELLHERTRWLVIPDGALWAIPFAALPDPEHAQQYLLERVTVGYLTSIHELASAPASSPPLEHALFVGGPDFGPEDSRPLVLTENGPCAFDAFGQLQGALEEVTDLSSLVRSSLLLTGRDATKQRLKSELEQRPRILHLATHAYFGGRNSCTGKESVGFRWRATDGPIAPNPLLLSGIALAGANRGVVVDAGEDSGILTAYEVTGLDLSSTRLVVLSACDTGAGVVHRGQELQGFRWGFRAAGATALLTSLWQSNDTATRDLMKTFYQILRKEETAPDLFRGPEALRTAQRALIASDRRLGLRRPLRWAPFVFSGFF